MKTKLTREKVRIPDNAAAAALPVGVALTLLGVLLGGRLPGGGVLGGAALSCAGILLILKHGKAPFRRRLIRFLGNGTVEALLLRLAAALGLALTLWLALWALVPGLSQNLGFAVQIIGNGFAALTMALLTAAALTALERKGGRSC